MLPYNVEIFDNEFNFKMHANVGQINFNEDYLSPEENTITIKYNANVKKSDFIRIWRGNEQYSGIVTNVTTGSGVNSALVSKNLMTVSYMPWIKLFGIDILFDTDLQGGNVSLEQFIANTISSYFINNSDTVQNISGLSVSVLTNTMGWGFHITSVVEGQHYAVVNFLNSILVRAMEKYQVRLLFDVDFENKTISVKIGKNELAQVTIEADLPNIINRSIVLHSNSNDTNKLIVYDMTNVDTSKAYYLHSNDTYDTSNTDRIVPVVLEIAGVVPTESENFDSMADAYASNLFNSISYNNLIELEMINNDELVKPQNMSIGQTLNIVSGGQSYSTILTGRRIGSTITLICGTVRLDLTKILLNN